MTHPVDCLIFIYIEITALTHICNEISALRKIRTGLFTFVIHGFIQRQFSPDKSGMCFFLYLRIKESLLPK